MLEHAGEESHGIDVERRVRLCIHATVFSISVYCLRYGKM